MSNEGHLRCAIVGETTLPAHCAQILREHGHSVSVVATDEPETIRSAAEADVSAIVSARELCQSLEQSPVDYLFSINNLSLIEEAVLALPARGAVNFHDGPLPAYSGLNAPSWGIVQGARSWAVTWHLMTSSIDEGEILLEEPVDIGPDDTSLTLNMKCFEGAIRSFPKLVVGLSQGGLARREQDLDKRVYFGRGRRPTAACALLWSRPAHELSALVRALDFGAYPNRLGLPKLLLEDDAVAVSALEVLDRRAGAPPGTLLAIGADSITVATATSDVVVRGMRTLEGRTLGLEELVVQYSLCQGQRLPEPSDEQIEGLTEFDESLAQHEEFWTSKLSELPALHLPGRSTPVRVDLGDPEVKSSETGPARAVHAVPADARSALDGVVADGSQSDAVVAALVLFLARLAGESTFAVAYSEPTLGSPVASGGAMISPIAPLRCELDSHGSIDRAVADVLDELREIRRRAPYQRDLIARMPKLANGFEPSWVAICESEYESPRIPNEAKLALVVADGGSRIDWLYDRDALSDEAIAAMRRQFDAFLSAVSGDPRQPLGELSVLTDDDRQQVLVDWNDTVVDYPRDVCFHELIEQQASRTPDRIAVVCRARRITYVELCRRADHFARHLRSLGVGPGERVGVCLERSAELVVWLLAILKAGGAYVPLDPSYPTERIRFMIEDSKPVVVLCEQSAAVDLLDGVKGLLVIDPDPQPISRVGDGVIESTARPEDPAYVIYTSGSTGRPKGVMVSHRNVVNFFFGMDARIDHRDPGSFLAVTSISFDISVLELFWTLARGFQVILQTGSDLRPPTSEAPSRPIDFSLFFFASRERDGALERYRLLAEAVKFADCHGFSAVWTPERHFHAFGGLFPNPSVTSAAIAATTKQVKIRAGSVVSPLHNPIRIAEEWSFVDNISNGRVGISVASGWQPDDFALAPDNFDDRKQLMFRQIELVQKLWRGESVALPGPLGKDVEIQILPRPIQPELPVWITAAGSPDTFRMAGEHGFGVLTHLLGQSVAELGQKIAIYRQALQSDGDRPPHGHVVLMLHTFVGPDNGHVRELVRAPMKAYLRSSVDLIQRAAWTFPTFKQATMNADGRFSLDHLTAQELDEMLDFAFERYFETSGLLGTPKKCLELLEQLREVDVDEVACLIDFHSDTDAVLAHLPNLDEVRSRCASRTTSAEDESIPALIPRYGVTHMQCTPSLASMLVHSPAGRRALGSLSQLLVGGEALPPALADELAELVAGDVVNMYGPTETTIWSSTFRVKSNDQTIPIGRPIANTQLYILDHARHPVAPGTPGELYIGGDGVTLGYLGRPELTAERFAPNPFSDRAGARMYRTGDLARHRKDGNVEFLGRTDHQVKIRGYRIELGEVEATLGRHPDIGETVVVAVGDGQESDTRLIAYVTGRNGVVPSVDSLRDHLKHKLPDFMVPSRFELVDTLPRTPNGKVDRSALLPPGASQATRPTESRSAHDELERTLVKIWEDALGVGPISIQDNFFELGGHSLLAMRVFAELKRKLDIELPLAAFLRAQTIEQLSGVIARHEGTESHRNSNSLVGRSHHSVESMSYEKENRWRAAKNRVLQEFAQVLPGARTLRVKLHRTRGVNIGDNVWIGYDAVLETAFPELITIEDNVSIGLRVVILAHFVEATSVKIERDAFLGPGVIVLPSAVVGHGAVVTAGSVVRQSIPPLTVAQGNPAVPIAKVDTPLRLDGRAFEKSSGGLMRIT